jgi:hypothetical protein
MQADDCGLSLARVRSYNVKSQLCETHHKAFQFLLDGCVSRFCQQCCKIHPLSEFDSNKR